MFAKQATVLTRDSFVAFACCVFEAYSIENRYLAVLIVDDAGPLQRARRDAYGSATHAKHDRDQILRKR